MTKGLNTKMAVLAMVLLGLVACAGKPVTEGDGRVEGLPDAAGETKDIQIIGSDITNTGPDGASGVLTGREDGAAASPLNVVYFDYDSAAVREEYKPLLQSHANFLLANPAAKVTLEGHADERGTREYNLALGENRAYKIKQFLLLQGVRQEQIATASFGEEKPDVDEHTEAAWAKNRRAVFVYAAN